MDGAEHDRERGEGRPSSVSERHSLLFPANLALSVLLFVFDVTAPLGVSSGVLHMAPVLGATWLPAKRSVIDFAILGTLLIAAGFWLSPSPGGAEAWMILANRTIAVLAVWATAGVTIGWKAAQEEEERASAAFQVAAEQRRSESLLRQEEERLRLAVLAEHDTVWDWTDVERGEEWWSPRFYEILGYDKGEIEPRLSPWKSLLHPADEARTVAAVEDCVEGRGPFDLEYRLRTKAGEYRWFRVRGLAFDDESNTRRRMLVAISDIHDRKHSEALFQTAFHGAPNGMLVVDHQGRIMLVNDRAQEMFGYSAEELAGQEVEMLIPESLRHSHRSDRDGFLRDPQPRPMGSGRDLFARRKDGRNLPIEIGLNPVGDAGERMVLASIVDISARKADQEKLEQYLLDLSEAQLVAERQASELRSSNESLQHFAYAASHDLQEPLRTLISYTTLLREDLGGNLPPEAVEDMRHISEASTRMQRLVKDVLALSRADRLEITAEKVALEQCVSESLESLQARIVDTGAQVKRDPLPNVVGDRRLLTQLFQNLIANAMKFQAEDVQPRIAVSASRDGSDWVIGVHDNGIGIDPKYAEQIFIPFRRLHGMSEYEGSGVGLAICKKAVERLGGRIWVESEPGRGACFKFALPATDESH